MKVPVREGAPVVLFTQSLDPRVLVEWTRVQFLFSRRVCVCGCVCVFALVQLFFFFFLK